MFFRTLELFLFIFIEVQCLVMEECYNIRNSKPIDINALEKFAKAAVPVLEGKHKGEAGKIGVIGGSVEYTGAPYFSAITSLRVGADLVHVITTESAAPIIKGYSPDLIVYPFLHSKYMSKINTILTKMDLIIIGPGLGRANDTIDLVSEIMTSCKELHIPLVVDADGLYILAKNPSVLKDYLRPGVILTPNFSEKNRLMNAIDDNSSATITYWGPYVSILTKGEEDVFSSVFPKYNWNLSLGGSGRRAGGQGDILSGILGTFFNWALRSKICENDTSDNLAASVASFVAAKMTRICNEKSFKLLGRSMLASDMLSQINYAFNNL